MFSSYRKGYQDGAIDIIDLLKYGLLKDCKTIEDVYKKLEELEIAIKELKLEEIKKQLALFA